MALEGLMVLDCTNGFTYVGLMGDQAAAREGAESGVLLSNYIVLSTRELVDKGPAYALQSYREKPDNQRGRNHIINRSQIVAQGMV